MEEEWKQIIDYPNYSISNFGNVRNDKTRKLVKSFERKGHSSTQLRFYRRGGPALTIHKLVALNFIENSNPELFTQVDHIDRNTFNNHYTNLRWVTPSQNSFNRRNKKNIKGAYKQGNRWRCIINHKNTGRQNIGYFATEEEAGLAYNQFIIANNLEEFCELNKF